MNINWEELIKGAAENLEKDAWLPPTSMVDAATRGVVGTGKALYGAGSFVHGAAGALGEATSGLGEAAGKAAPLALTALLASKGNRMGGLPAAVAPRPNTPLTYMTRRTGDVNSLREPIRAPSQGGKIAIGSIVDSVGWAARNRMANGVLDTALGKPPESHKPKSEGEVELVTHYPELKHMLKDEDTQDHLQRLLHEKH